MKVAFIAREPIRMALKLDFDGKTVRELGVVVLNNVYVFDIHGSHCAKLKFKNYVKV